MAKRSTQSRKGVKGQRPLWGLGQRPNCSSSDQSQGSRQQRRRQRSVPASNFARPQTRPPTCSTHYLHIVAPIGATDQHRKALFFGAVFLHSSRISGAENAIKNKHSFVCYSRRICGHEVAIKVSCEKELFSIDQLEFVCHKFLQKILNSA